VSIDSDVPQALPSREAVTMILANFGYGWTDVAFGWSEEYEPTKYAINMLIPQTPTTETRQ
jgi:hypothetical protein